MYKFSMTLNNSTMVLTSVEFNKLVYENKPYFKACFQSMPCFEKQVN